MIYDRTYGVEIECIVSRSRAEVAAALVAAGVPAFDAGYSHTTSNRWKVVSDASVHGGMELVSPPLQGEDGHEQINKVSAVLSQLGATVNQSCGLHVHVNARAMSSAALRKLALTYLSHEELIDSIMPPSRRGSANRYCMTLRSSNMAALNRAADVTQIANAIQSGSRFVKLNFTSFWRHGTVEFRHHSGTTDAAKINLWILHCLRMCEYASKVEHVAVTSSTGGAIVSDRPRNRRLQIIYDMMAAPNGTTRQAVAERLGRTSLPPMNRILTEANIAYEERRIGHVAHYFLKTVGGAAVAVAVEATTETATTIEDFAAMLEMTDAEKTFWLNRQASLSTRRI